MLNLDLWDTPRRAQRTLRRGHSNLVSSVRFFPGSEREVVSGGADCRLVHWNAARLQQVRVIDIPTETSGQGSSDLFSTYMCKIKCLVRVASHNR